MQHPNRLVIPFLLLALGLGACGGDAPPAAEPGSARSLAQGELVGFASRGAHAWLGIPFAAAPVGELRWRAPRPPRAWDGVREALTHGPACPQLDQSSEPTGDEDCLSLNVYAPATTSDAGPSGEGPLPVMVFIHGGGNTIGRREPVSPSQQLIPW